MRLIKNLKKSKHNKPAVSPHHSKSEAKGYINANTIQKQDECHT